ncbi:spermidine synthase [Solemya velum gill symbiont]|uniref:polyamine aminopropyltransferase n=1 Tax=Solemya velum gill symbiont TaxID=2340 RepID=UPI00099815E5|nr:polyamine aminopropyltransferase [Solemya velum gill symbiont]OOZ43506.1 spermidine synthase [Solemya velum gill symbiont]OOZ45444.1 spermidine synthase [Solemya velum gill symbiont]OOZ48329.1 spermidine synthase [Solemya velum gill symbiont]OOZ50261.1 spermidine synthase [Solemya velum gill symbiont]OOZ53438.1 spermidine synthase [Solemya velum gill symbiont]
MLDRNWFSEAMDGTGSAISLKITGKLHEETSNYQKIEVYETTEWGNLMVIDDCTMVSTRDNFLYHEMMSHPALFTHPAPKNVAIIGGGDCGTLREVLKHTEVEHATQIDIDERVTRVSEIYFPELCESNNDPRAELLFIDGIKWMQEAQPGSLDVIIVDSTDPVGPGKVLFSAAFYKACFEALGEDGVMVQQSESPLLHEELIRCMSADMHKAGFFATRLLSFPQPVYPSGWWSATMAGKGGLDTFRADAARERSFETRYYNEGIHLGALATPQFLHDL